MKKGAAAKVMNTEVAELKDSSFLVQLVYPAMVAMGLDIQQVCERCNITPQLLHDVNARFPHAAQIHFWKVLEEVSGDSAIGLHLAERVEVYRGQVLEYLFLSSPTFGEGLRRALNYQRLVTDASQIELVVEDDSACLRLRFSGDDAPSLRHRDECFSLFLLRYFDAITNSAFAARAVHFRHPLGGDAEDYRRAFGCEVVFEQDDQGIYFDREILDIPSSHAEPELLRLHEELASQRLARLEKQEVVDDVKRVIAEILEQGQPDLETIAGRLGTSARNLRARLSDAGTSFNQVLADYRCILAKRLLAQTDESISDVVYLTGFSEPSTFYRAFKRWTGMTPVEYREQKRSEPEDS